MELLLAKDNTYTSKVNSVYIHSRYSPEKEADKFVEQGITSSKGAVVVIGPGLGYIYRSIERKYPNLDIIGIQLIDQFKDCPERMVPEKGTHLDSIDDIDNYLKNSIREDNIKGLQILEWQPAIKVSPNNYNRVNNALVKRVRFINGNIMTTARFGKLWIKNSLRNYINIDSYINSFSINKPVVITTSGSSLKRNLGGIKAIRERVTLFALSSSLLALNKAGIVPDLVFSTDPGFYSKLHLYNYRGPLVMPLANSTSNRCPVLLLNTENYFEDEIFKFGNLPSINIPENGTVAGTALLFALRNTREKVFLLGQDLGGADIKSHVSPYAFDNLLKSRESRINPYYNTMFTRWINSGVTYSTYRDWYSNIGLKWGDRIARVDPNGLPLDNIKDISLNEFSNLIPEVSSKNFTYSINESKPKSERIKDVIAILKKWQDSLNKKISLNELIYLISPGKSADESTRESLRFIKELLKLYGRKLL